MFQVQTLFGRPQKLLQMVRYLSYFVCPWIVNIDKVFVNAGGPDLNILNTYFRGFKNTTFHCVECYTLKFR